MPAVISRARSPRLLKPAPPPPSKGELTLMWEGTLIRLSPSAAVPRARRGDGYVSDMPSDARLWLLRSASAMRACEHSQEGRSFYILLSSPPLHHGGSPTPSISFALCVSATERLKHITTKPTLRQLSLADKFAHATRARREQATTRTRRTRRTHSHRLASSFVLNLNYLVCALLGGHPVNVPFLPSPKAHGTICWWCWPWRRLASNSPRLRR